MNKKKGKGNRNYKLGYAFELRVKKHLESLGYLVIRSAGSHGPIDLVAIPYWSMTAYYDPPQAPPLVMLVQCKRDGKLSPKERKAISLLTDRHAGDFQLAYMPGKRGIAFKEIL